MSAIVELSIPTADTFRRVWCFFDNTTMTSPGDEAWVRFYKDGEKVTEIPALVVLASNFSIRCAWGPAIFTASSTNVGGRNIIWYNNTDANPYYGVHPFDVLCEADSVRLETSKGGVTRAMLAVLSTPQSLA